MPRGIAHCTCSKCGATFDKELYTSGKGASKALAEKIEWAEGGGIDLCTDCFVASKREAEKAAGLTCKIILGSPMAETPRVYAVFGGDTYSHKDALKEIGARWTDQYPVSMGLVGLLNICGPDRKAWVVDVSPVDGMEAALDALGLKLTALDSKVEWPSREDLAIWAAARQNVEQIRKEEAEKKAAENAEREDSKQAALAALGPKPSYPDRIRAAWPDNGRWNGTVYGKPGKHRVYLGGVEVMVSDEEAAAMTATLAARREWQAKVDEINKKFA